MKYILFDKIRIGAYEESHKFYLEYFVTMLKKTHPNCWERKNVSFFTILNNPDLLRTYDYLIKSEQNFQNFINKLDLKLNIYISNIKINNNELFEEGENLNSNINLESEIVSCKSTCDYLSDLEDEIIYNNKTEISTTRSEPKKYSILGHLKDSNSTYYSQSKEYFPKIRKEIDRIYFKENIPLLRDFNPKYTKKTNIDKKILRRFKNYLKEKYDNIKFGDNNLLTKFWEKFVKENMLPPINIEEEKIEFKCFNTKYLLWLFGKDNAIDLYEEFLTNQGKETLDIMIKEYKIENKIELVDQLEFYLYHLGEVFANLQKENCFINKNKFKEENETKNSNGDEIKISLCEAPLNPLSYEKVFENYIGQNFDLEKNNIKDKNDIFDMLHLNYLENKKRNPRSKKSNSSVELNKSLDRSRELDYPLFDSLVKSDESTEKEE